MSFDPTPNTFQTSTPPLGPPPAQNQTPMILAICSLVGGVLGLVSCLCCLFLPFPVVSIVLGGIALSKKPEQNAKIMAIVGIVLSVLSLIVTLIAFFINGAVMLSNPEFQRAFN